MTDLARLVVRLQADSNRLQADLDKAQRRIATFESRTRRSTAAVDQAFARVGRNIAASFAALASVATVRQLVKINDEYTRLEGRLRLVTGSSEDLKSVQSALFDVAQRTRTEYASVADLYIRLAQTSAELGASQQDLLKFSEGVGNALTISGTSAQQASGALIQLSQALGSGIVRAEEFNSILEGAPEIVRTVAQNIDGMGGSIAKLRQAVIAGQVTSDVFFSAFLRGSDELAAKAQSLPVTVGQAFTRLQNVIKQAVAGADISPLVGSINELSGIVSDPGFQQSFIAFVNASVRLANLSFKGMDALVRGVERVAEATARAATGVELDERNRLNILLDERLRMIEKIRRAESAGIKPKFIEQYRAELAALEQQINWVNADLQNLGRAALASAGKPAAAPVSEESTRNNLGIKLAGAAKIDPMKGLSEVQVYARPIFDFANARNEALAAFSADAVENLRSTMQDLTNETTRMLGTMTIETEQAVSAWAEFAEQGARNIQDAFAQFLFDPFSDGLKGMVRGFVDSIRQMIAQYLAFQVITGIGGALGNSENPFLKSIGGFLSGKRAMGGPVAAGGAYLVGESGPELFVPSASGQIIPNGAMAGVSVNYTIDARGADADRVMAIMPGLLRQTEQRTVARVQELLQRGRLA